MTCAISRRESAIPRSELLAPLDAPVRRAARPSAQDMSPTIKAMHKGLAASDLGWLLRPRGTDEAKRAWLDGTSMPGLVVSLMIMPAVVGYGKEATARLEELTEGKRREEGGGCCIA